MHQVAKALSENITYPQGLPPHPCRRALSAEILRR